MLQNQESGDMPAVSIAFVEIVGVQLPVAQTLT